MAGKKVLITDPVAEVCPTILQEQGLDVDLRTGLTAQQIGQIIEPYHGLIVRSGTRVTAEIIERAHNLQVIGRAGVGVDNIDVTAATRHNIAVLNAASANTISTAEHTLALMLALARKIPQAHQSLMEGRWERSKFKGVELFGKTLGIVGLGKVGREVAK
ncbi:MAG: phosphoglycerate dehydrogenase, partial [Calditrichaeota bacterium]